MGLSPEERLKELLTGGALSPLAVAESCTGGLIASRVTAVPGSSAYFDRGLVVYSNRAKAELLGVDPLLIEREGAVSAQTAEAMLSGLFERTPASLGAAVTGIAGPDGGTPEKPVGTVWIAWGSRSDRRVRLLNLAGGRAAIRDAAADAVLEELCDFAGGG